MNYVLSWERIAKKESLEEGLEEGREEGREEGKTEALRNVAMECLKNDMDIEIIEKLTHLSKKEIEELAAKSKSIIKDKLESVSK